LAAFVEAEKPVTGITKLFSKLQSRSTVTNWSFTIFDDIISPDYIDHGQSAYMDSPGRGIAGAKNDLKNSLDKLDDFHYTVEAMIASAGYPDLVGTYWKGSLTPKATSDIPQTNRIITYRGVSIYRIQNGKMVETWHVVDGWPLRLQEQREKYNFG
jgi:predicted ester cyclase